MMCDASMHRGESLPHGVPATLFSRPADFHASPSFALRTLSFSPSALSPFALSVAERSRRVIFEAPPFDCGPTGLRSGRTAGPKLNLTPALRSLSVRPERSGAKSKALEAHPSTAALRAYAQGERLGRNSISLQPSAPSPFVLSVAERSRRHSRRAPFDFGPTGLRSGRTERERRGIWAVIGR
jgi:hypothetical protein